ncbi:MAG: hypothetical protein A2031_01315 [Deltaproteobacteria bacterium RBG_19FT_COMBO_43_11]|nr:MAG: hypothetical protein A2W27_10125 [Deltaproteobacteria bacterium RBG_16_44_11]OGP89519.1 MAG: hypothetical protein A2031_01315 [Deltaproteobacteria bacterium RBG_19FT_COMBO_43_11]
MEHLETIDFQHRELLMNSFKNLNLPISDYTYANVYLFRKVSHYEFLTMDCGLFISGNNKQGQSYVMPLNDLRSCDMQIFIDLLDKHGFFFPIPEEWLTFFPKDKFTVLSDESEADYIYLTQNLASFKGSQYTRHRNHLNQFFASYEPQASPIAANNLPDTMSILNQWQADSRLAREKTDFEQCSEALEKFSALALWGTIYYIEKEPAGFIIGEALNADTFCLHFAKASKNYHGIYEFMFNDTAKRLQSQYKYLNLEEDMGNKNLRRTKGSYGPEKLLKKYRISRKA